MPYFVVRRGESPLSIETTGRNVSCGAVYCAAYGLGVRQREQGNTYEIHLNHSMICRNRSIPCSNRVVENGILVSAWHLGGDRQAQEALIAQGHAIRSRNSRFPCVRATGVG